MSEENQEQMEFKDGHVAALLDELAAVKIQLAESQARCADLEACRARMARPDGTETQPGNRTEWFKQALERNEKAVEAEREARHELSRSLQHKVDRVREDAERRIMGLREQISEQETTLKDIQEAAGAVGADVESARLLAIKAHDKAGKQQEEAKKAKAAYEAVATEKQKLRSDLDNIKSEYDQAQQSRQQQLQRVEASLRSELQSTKNQLDSAQPVVDEDRF